MGGGWLDRILDERKRLRASQRKQEKTRYYRHDRTNPQASETAPILPSGAPTRESRSNRKKRLRPHVSEVCLANPDSCKFDSLANRQISRPPRRSGHKAAAG